MSIKIVNVMFTFESSKNFRIFLLKVSSLLSVLVAFMFVYFILSNENLYYRGKLLLDSLSALLSYELLIIQLLYKIN